MKELSIEQKAKAYDEKLDVARHVYADPSVKDEDKYYIEVIFPELAESEDERIRKELIFYFQEEIPQCSIQEHADKMKEFIAWLEKQGEITKEWSEMKMNNIQTELQEMVDLKQKTEQGEQKPAWSEEDEYNHGIITTQLIGGSVSLQDREDAIKWFKSLKDRYTWKPSDEQLDALHDAAVYVDKSMFPHPKGILMKLYKQLKKLREE